MEEPTAPPGVRTALRRLQHHARQGMAAAAQLARYAGEELGVYTVAAGTEVAPEDVAAWVQLVAAARDVNCDLYITIHSGLPPAAEEERNAEDSQR